MRSFFIVRRSAPGSLYQEECYEDVQQFEQHDFGEELRKIRYITISQNMITFSRIPYLYTPSCSSIRSNQHVIFTNARIKNTCYCLSRLIDHLNDSLIIHTEIYVMLYTYIYMYIYTILILYPIVYIIL